MSSRDDSGRAALLDYLCSSNVRHRREVEDFARVKKAGIMGATAALKARSRTELERVAAQHQEQVAALQQAHREKVRSLELQLDAAKLDTASYRRRFEKSDKLRLQTLRELRAFQASIKGTKEAHAAEVKVLQQELRTVVKQAEKYRNNSTTLSHTDSGLAEQLNEALDQNDQLKEELQASQQTVQDLQAHLHALEDQCSRFQARLDVYGIADNKVRMLAQTMKGVVNELASAASTTNGSANGSSTIGSEFGSDARTEPSSFSHSAQCSDDTHDHHHEDSRERIIETLSHDADGPGAAHSETKSGTTTHRRQCSESKRDEARHSGKRKAARGRSRRDKHSVRSTVEQALSTARAQRSSLRPVASSSSGSHQLKKPLQDVVNRLQKDVARVMHRSAELKARVKVLETANRNLELANFNLKSKLAGKTKIATLMKFKLMKVAGNRAVAAAEAEAGGERSARTSPATVETGSTGHVVADFGASHDSGASDLNVSARPRSHSDGTSDRLLGSGDELDNHGDHAGEAKHGTSVVGRQATTHGAVGDHSDEDGSPRRVAGRVGGETTDSPADFGLSDGDEFDFRLLQKDLEANLREQLRRENYERLADAMGMEDLEKGCVGSYLMDQCTPLLTVPMLLAFTHSFILCMCSLTCAPRTH